MSRPPPPTAARSREWLGFFLALGVVIVFLAAIALGRMSVVSVRDARIVSRRAHEDENTDDSTDRREESTTPTPSGHHLRRHSDAT